MNPLVLTACGITIADIVATAIYLVKTDFGRICTKVRTTAYTAEQTYADAEEACPDWAAPVKWRDSL